MSLGERTQRLVRERPEIERLIHELGVAAATIDCRVEVHFIPVIEGSPGASSGEQGYSWDEGERGI